MRRLCSRCCVGEWVLNELMGTSFLCVGRLFPFDLDLEMLSPVLLMRSGLAQISISQIGSLTC